MKIKDAAKLAHKDISANSNRFILPAIGIAIGIATIGIISSYSIMANLTLERGLGSIGNVITLNSEGDGIPEESLSSIEKIDGVSMVLPIDNRFMNISYDGKNIVTSVMSVPTGYKGMAKLMDGEYISSSRRECNIGEFVHKQYNISVGDSISVGGHKYRVRGIIKNELESAPLGLGVVICDGSSKNNPASVKILVESNKVLKGVMEQIESILRDSDVSVSALGSSVEKLSEAQESTTVLLESIGLIALIVGAMAIANVMYTSIMEKRREIGVMIAIGGQKRDIVMIYLLEGVFLGCIGSMMGTLVSYSIGTGMIVMKFETISIEIFRPVLISLLLGPLIAIVASIYPAYSASRVDPAITLRSL